MLKTYEKPTQVHFLEVGVGDNYGIAYERTIICGCCGGVIDFDEYDEGDLIILEELPWVPLNEEIKGDLE